MKLLELRPMLEVRDMDEAIDFYEKKLGFTCVDRLGNRDLLPDRNF